MCLNILIIGPESPLSHKLVEHLRQAGCDVGTASDGVAGMRITAHPDLVVLPEQLPDGDALELYRRIRRQFTHQRPPMFLVTPEPIESLADAMGIGPTTFTNWQEAAAHGPQQVVCGDLCLDERQHRATIAGRELVLTPTEFRILRILACEPGRVFSRKELTRACRGEHKQLQARTIDVHIRSLRQKMDRHATLIQTVHGVGYRMKKPVD